MNRKQKNPLLFVIAAAAVIIGSCGTDEQQEEIIRPVRYIEVFMQGGSRVRSFTGVARAGTESRLSFKIPGTVKNLPVNTGDRVRAGDPIARLDRTDYELQVQQAEAGLANTRAQARNADASYSRVRALYESNGSSKSDLDAARAGSESAAAAVRQAEKQLELARLQLRYTNLTAPVDGSIAQVNIEVNENVQAGKSVVTLLSDATIEVELSIPEILIALIKEGEKATVSFDAIPDMEYQATITEVGVTATGTVTTFPVTVQIDRKDEQIRPGMAAQAAFRFISRDTRERCIVPSSAVSEDRQGRFVLIVEPTGVEDGYGLVHRRQVTVGDLTGDGLEIFEGLEDGDLLVTAGISHIIDGQKVRIR